jgi:hypothetical protein
MVSELVESFESYFPSEVCFMGKIQDWRIRRLKRRLRKIVLFDV